MVMPGGTCWKRYTRRTYPSKYLSLKRAPTRVFPLRAVTILLVNSIFMPVSCTTWTASRDGYRRCCIAAVSLHVLAIFGRSLLEILRGLAKYF
ncbi:hypothetical protein LZ31DRAFT_349939 [Colletotrichum somersetense]|nr:hypothetical protein LZ31DRAFT_349939 [Colletotrichum somersetense]